MQEEQQQPKGIHYQINEHGKYKVSARQWGEKTFYNVYYTLKNADGTEVKYPRQLIFRNCEPPENGDIIKITDGFEGGYYNKKDPYNPVVTLIVNSYEVVNETSDEEAYEKFNETVKENGGDIEIKDSDLPF